MKNWRTRKSHYIDNWVEIVFSFSAVFTLNLLKLITFNHCFSLLSSPHNTTEIKRNNSFFMPKAKNESFETQNLFIIYSYYFDYYFMIIIEISSMLVNWTFILNSAGIKSTENRRSPSQEKAKVKKIDTIKINLQDLQERMNEWKVICRLHFYFFKRKQLCLTILLSSFTGNFSTYSLIFITLFLLLLLMVLSINCNLSTMIIEHKTESWEESTSSTVQKSI